MRCANPMSTFATRDLVAKVDVGSLRKVNEGFAANTAGDGHCFPRKQPWKTCKVCVCLENA